MEKGDRVDRFVIDREAGVGGMGRVYRAFVSGNEASGDVVALKVLHVKAAEAEERFDREVKLLQKLQHPGIVKYVAHGRTADGHRWLAMEWLDGEPLGKRIAVHGHLPVRDVVAIGREIAEALGAAHSIGIVHRDVKPQNLMVLRQGGVKVLDLGIARFFRESQTISLTRTGMVVGSFHYMSPEQALGGSSIDARSDMFSLGCVLYECLTGKRAFHAHDATAVLAKILLDAPTPIAELRPNVPAALVAIIDRLLAKNAADRPASGSEVADALASIGEISSAVSPASIRPPPVLGQEEQRIVCMVFAKDVLDTDRTQVGDTSATATATATAVIDTDHVLRGLHEVAEKYRGELAILADGSALVTFGEGLGLDEATRGAHCALAIHAILRDRPVALALGRGVVNERAPIGSVIELAVAALDRSTPDQGVRLVGVSEGLLGPHFEIRGDEHGLVLVGAKNTTRARTLLGRETTCVGRERELRTLEALYGECREERSPRAALVTGSPGFGKSRVRYELAKRLASSGADEPPSILIGRGDVVGAGSPFSMLRDAMTAAAGVHEAMTPNAQATALGAHLDALLSDRSQDDRAVTAGFLGELCGIPMPPTDALVAARGDTRAMGDGMRVAFEDWLRAYLRRAPLFLVLEDLHWGDLPTVRFVDAALRDLAGERLFVLALARPEVSERFPNLWKDHALLQLPLGPLARKAQEKLVREVLGEGVSPGDVERIVQHSEGNAFFLEELIRTFSDHSTTEGALPKSVLAIVQARLDALDPETRRVLRAASVFGERFTRAGVGHLVRDADVPSALDVLARQEILTPSGDGSYVFRHALVRESAYALLTDDDRRLGHVLAAEWLEAQGENDALVLAEHFERGGKRERVARWLHRAAHQALGGDDLGQVIALADKALGSTTDREARGRLLWVQAEAHRWRGEMARALEKSARAVDLLPPGSVDFYFALGEAIASCAFSGNFTGAGPFFERALSTPASEDANAAKVVSLARGCTQMLEAGRYAEVDAIMLQFAGDDIDALPDVARGWVRWLLAMRALCAGDLGSFIESTEACLASFQRLAESRNVCSQRTNLGYAYIELGDYTRGEELLRQVLHDAERLGLPMIVAYALHNLGNAVASQGRLDEGIAFETRAVEVASRMHDPRIEGASRTYVAKMALEMGDLERAASETARAIELLKEHPALLALAHAMRGLVHLERREHEDALAQTSIATQILEAHGAFEDGETSVRLAHVRALVAKGDCSGAADAARAAKERLLARAARIKDSRWRDTFLTNVPDSRDTLAVAESMGE